jgi:hypothetical protein
MTSRRSPPTLRVVGDGEEPPPPLTVEQREALARWLSHVFVYLRSPGYGYYWNSKDEWHDVKKLQATVDRAVAIGEAFHNVPYFFVRDGFKFDLQETIMKAYLRQCPEMEHLISELQEIRDMGEKRKA